MNKVKFRAYKVVDTRLKEKVSHFLKRDENRRVIVVSVRSRNIETIGQCKRRKKKKKRERKSFLHLLHDS